MISGRGGSAARAGRIRPPRRIFTPKAGTEGTDFDACWDMLKQALIDIHNKSCSQLSFEELYRAAYKIVLKKKGHVLYDRVKEFETDWFTSAVTPEILKLITASLLNIGVDRNGTSTNERRQTGETFLKGMRDRWEDHNTSMNMTADILMYVERGYVQIAEKVPIFTTTIALFRDEILRRPLSAESKSTIVDIVISVMLDQIDMEREGDVIDRNLIRSCSRMLSSLYETEQEAEDEKLYLTVFEPRFLAHSESFYSKECERLLRDSDCSAWLRHTQRRLREEVDRCGTTVELETLKKVSQVIERKLLVAHMDDFLKMEGSGLTFMIDNDKTEDLSILYQLISRVDEKKEALRDGLQKRVVSLGLEIEKVLSSTDFSTAPHDGEDAGDVGKSDKTKTLNAAAQLTAAAIKWVDDVLRLKEKFDGLCKRCFAEDRIIDSALTKSYSDFINMFPRCSEYVSLFVDDSLKRGIKGKTEAEIDAILAKAVELIQYLQDRDLFQTYYQRHLARRLLHGKSESYDVEKQIISKMKEGLGSQFTSKFEGMFKDLATSAELTNDYRTRIKAMGEGNKTIDLEINVLTTNNWPSDVMGRSAHIGEDSRVSCTYPREVERLKQSFERFYMSGRSGRKLTWIGTTGSADMRCVFPAIPGKSGPLAKERRYEVSVPTFAMVVMLLFNDLEDREFLTFEQIQEKTAIEAQDLQRALMAIAVAPKSRVLAKDPPTKTIKSGDKFSFNEAFVSKAIRIKAPIINAVSKVEGAQERKKTEDKTTQERGHVVDAAIVRIMKSRKELQHSQLVSEVLSQLTDRFKPDVSLIKLRIEDLISRDYLERPEDEDGPGIYRYVA